jgi:hypothetical protein
MKATKKFVTQFALWARLVAVARVAMGWISLAKSFTPSAHAVVIHYYFIAHGRNGGGRRGGGGEACS